MERQKSGDIEIWGGIECTINRVKDKYNDQLSYSGFYNRADDIDKIATLGIKRLRFPILWETHQQTLSTNIDWSWVSGKLDKLKQLDITPIAGLLHHGSGPSFTSLMDDNFPELLAAYAGKVAAAFPWLQYYTPINEPLTTARFSGLYGHWYPHHCNDISFAKMLLNQLKATVLCMKEIKKINPHVQLVQTEDLSKTYSTPALKFQASFENERRWLTFDILCGRLLPHTMMYKYFIRLGIDKSKLHFFIDNPCPPDVFGANYYITSERFLDDRLHLYPKHLHGGNELQQYADMEAIRVQHNFPSGLKVLLTEAWQRFGLPVAVTECHLHCTKEEQIRWVHDCWKNLHELKEEGIPVQALTVWALTGAYGWDKLLTDKRMNYEPGVFAVRNGQLHTGALYKFIKSLATSSQTDHHLCVQPGWWKKQSIKKFIAGMNTEKPLLITGKTGTLGNAFAKLCVQRNIPCLLVGREDADITDKVQFENLLSRIQPWAVINTAGMVNIDEAEKNEEKCFAANTTAPLMMAKLCGEKNIQLMLFSSDQVFDGAAQKNYTELDKPRPLNVYGRSKFIMETITSEVNPDVLIIRTSAFFSPWDKYNFAVQVLESLSTGLQFKAAFDIFISPTYVPHLVNQALDMLIDEEKGLYHLSCSGCVSWYQFAVEIARHAGLSSDLIVPVSGSEMQWTATRPVHATLSSVKGIKLPWVNDAIESFITELELIKIAGTKKTASANVV